MRNTLQKGKHIPLGIFVAFFITLAALGHGINLIPKEVVWGSGIIILIMFSLLTFRSKRIDIFFIDILWLAWIFIMLIHRSPEYPILDIAFYILGYLAMYVLRSNHASYKGVLLAITIFTVINMIVSVLSLVSQGAFAQIINTLRITNRNVNMHQVMTGLANGKSRNATLLVLGMSVFCSMLFAGITKKRKLITGLALCSVVLIMCTGKLSHFLYSIIVFMCIYLYTGNGLTKAMKRLMIALILGSLFLVAAVEFVPQAQYLVSKLVAKANSGDISTGRTEIWAIAFEKFLEAPILGHGYGSFQVNSASWTNLTAYAGVHNDYLQWLCETGLVGFFINITITAYSLIVGLKALKCVIVLDNSYWDKVLLIWSVFYQAFIVLYSFTGIPHFSYDASIPYIFACAIPYSMAKKLMLRKPVFALIV